MAGLTEAHEKRQARRHDVHIAGRLVWAEGGYYSTWTRTSQRTFRGMRNTPERMGPCLPTVREDSQRHRLEPFAYIIARAVEVIE
jgi:hypothetical protein